MTEPPSCRPFLLSGGLLIIVSVVLIPAIALCAAEFPPQTAVQWEPQEMRLTANDEHPWWSFPVTIDFAHQATGERLVVEAYWDGGRQWVIGFAASQPGVWTWQTFSDDAGLNGQSGRFEVRPPTKEETARNPNYRGHLRISSNGRYFGYADGTPVFLLADTLWSGNTLRCGLGEQQDGPFFQYLADRQAKGFTTILIKYLNGFDDGPSNPKGERNEGGYAFLNRDFDRLNPSYFQALDRRMAAIWSYGFVAAIPTAWWGKTKQCVFDIRWAKRVGSYCAVRYGAYNSLWCLSGEYQYAFKDCGWTEGSFNDMGRTVRTHNPYGHPLSIHPSARLDWPAPHSCQSSRPFHQSGWLDHHWLQTGQSVDRMYNIVTRAGENRALSPPRPVFCSEACYDASDDADQAYHARWQAWIAMLGGCAGYGYGAHGIWQFYDPADPEGETGKRDKRAVPWSRALRFGGSAMMLPVRSFLNRYPWWRLEPHRDWLLIEGRPCPHPSAADLTPPHCAAVPGELYVVYIPRGNESRFIKLTNVQTNSYRSAWYNPRTGETTPLGPAIIDRAEWSIPRRPSPTDEDWVLLLRKR
jgi:hypothetical protein